MTREEFETLEPGDVVRVVPSRNQGFESSGMMDKWLGACVTVEHVDSIHHHLTILEDFNDGGCHGNGHWRWMPSMLESIVSRIDDVDFETASEDELKNFILKGKP